MCFRGVGVTWSLSPSAKATGKSLCSSNDSLVCCLANMRDGHMIAAFAKRIAPDDPNTEAFEDISAFEPGNPETRTNDGRTDRQGRFIVGGMNEVSGKADSSVIRIDPHGSVTALIEDVVCANSTCVSPYGRTMFFTNTPEQILRADDYGYDCDPNTGAPGAIRILADFAE